MKPTPDRRSRKKRRRVPSSVRILRDLPNTAEDVRAAICGSLGEAQDFVRQREPVCAHGSRGGLLAWRDDDGTWECQLKDRNGETVAAALYSHDAAAAAWLAEQWPKLHQ